ncbi:MAG: hypothetical protein ACXVA9_13865 [Bdellovibrionales bacterium]
MSSECITCKNQKAPLTCGVCAAHVCKACAQFASEESVALMEVIPAHYELGAFCQDCFDQTIAPEIAVYNEVLERAEKVDIFYKTQSKESRFIRRTEKAIKVKACVDKDTAVMKLAFIAAQKGFNILVDVETDHDKIRMAGWQTSTCDGSAIPGYIDPDKLKRRFVSSPN